MSGQRENCPYAHLNIVFGEGAIQLSIQIPNIVLGLGIDAKIYGREPRDHLLRFRKGRIGGGSCHGD
jgi:hypothetical protein